MPVWTCSTPPAIRMFRGARAPDRRQRVRVTLLMFRGASGSRPRARVRWRAWSWPATIDDDRRRATPACPAAARSGQLARPSASGTSRERPPGRRRGRRGAARAARPGPPRPVPARTTARTGTPGSSSASGPCWKSAAEYGSAKTCASSLSLRAHSRAVAYSYPRATTSARSACGLVARPSRHRRARARAPRRSRPAPCQRAPRRPGPRQRRRQRGDRERARRVRLGRGDRPLRAGRQVDRQSPPPRPAPTPGRS